jgi:tRNA modification GTPase
MKNSGNDTIAAIATAAGGGIGIVRISGPDALCVAERIFRDRGGRSLAAAAPFRLVLGTVTDPASGTPIDEVLAVRMPGGRSYSGDPDGRDHAHGGRLSSTRSWGGLDAAREP